MTSVAIVDKIEVPKTMNIQETNLLSKCKQFGVSFTIFS